MKYWATGLTKILPHLLAFRSARAAGRGTPRGKAIARLFRLRAFCLSALPTLVMRRLSTRRPTRAGFFEANCPATFGSNIGKGMSVSDRDIIERLRAEYVDAFNHQDIRAMKAYVAADIDAMGPGRPAIRGIDAQVQFWHEGFAAARSVLFVLPDDLEVIGDVAVDRHRWVLDSLAKRDGRPAHDEGKGIWIWRRQADGGWKVVRSIWNSDLPHGSFRSSDQPAREAIRVAPIDAELGPLPVATCGALSPSFIPKNDGSIRIKLPFVTRPGPGSSSPDSDILPVRSGAIASPFWECAATDEGSSLTFASTM